MLLSLSATMSSSAFSVVQGGGASGSEQQTSATSVQATVLALPMLQGGKLVDGVWQPDEWGVSLSAAAVQSLSAGQEGQPSSAATEAGASTMNLSFTFASPFLGGMSDFVATSAADRATEAAIVGAVKSMVSLGTALSVSTHAAPSPSL